MSGLFWLDATALAVSLNNMILLIWLGLTILLNAERRTRGIWFVGSSLLLASLFFAGHSVILYLGLDALDASLDFWWHLIWVPVILLPFSWYLVTLWYSGFWENTERDRSRTNAWFLLATLLTIGMTVYIALANPLPSLAKSGSLDLNTPQINGVPNLLIVYSVDILLCLVLALDALRRPGPTVRVMGDLARRRARPWLIATSLVLFAVGCLAILAMVWLLLTAPRGLPPDRSTLVTLTWIDLVVAALIALATICVGQAVARYEVFTGKALPRHGFIRLWRNAVILATGYGVVVGSSLVLHTQPVYTVLLTTVLMTAFYALFNWRSFAERERYIQHLRPFVTSQHLYDHLLDGNAASPEIDAVTPFTGLVRDVLGARSANLTTVGPFAPLVPVLAYPGGTARPVRGQMDLTQFDSPQTMCVPLDSFEDEGALWAVPLWSERGLIGVLRLGEKSDGGLYTQEEIEIARASGERLIDTYASAELARRLMALQRQRLTETQLLDRQARRTLHDDVLPQLHAAMLMLDQSSTHSEAIDLLVRVHRRLADLLHDTPGNPHPEVSRLGLVSTLKEAVEYEWRKDFDGVSWQVEPAVEQHVQALPPLTVETLYFAAREAIRNAAHHGRSEIAQQTLNLEIQVAWKDGLAIVIQDDGVGLEAERRSEHGTGQGLALHSAMLAVVGGTCAIEPNGSRGTRVTLKLPAEACIPAR